MGFGVDILKVKIREGWNVLRCVVYETCPQWERLATLLRVVCSGMGAQKVDDAKTAEVG